jgi:tetratricopeptide (TPR) repeat protein
MRIPVTQDENDPLHLVIGRKPTQSLPWHINICRQRIRDGVVEASALSPTGIDHFHDPMKMAYFYGGLSHQFEAEPETDYLASIRAAETMGRTGHRDEALAAYTAAAESRITALQKSYALGQAAAMARSLRKHDLAAELATRIPLPAVRKTVVMQNMLDHYQAAAVVRQFAAEDIAAWPFWQRGEGYFARGQAYAATKAGKQADADSPAALAWTSNARTLDAIRLAMGQNREGNLHDEAGALAAYEAIVSRTTDFGGATELRALEGVVQIQARRGRFDEALATLDKADARKHRGYWHDSLLIDRGDVLLAAGRKSEALAVYKSILAGDSGDSRLRKVVEEKIKAAAK